MFSNGKRFAAILVATIMPIFAALWSAVLSKLTSGASGSPASGFYAYLPYIYVGTISLGSAGAVYFTHLKPPRDLEKPVLTFLAALAEKPLSLGKRQGIKPRMNVMIVERPWYLFFRRRIKVVWNIKMESFPDVKFRCYCHQGVIGQAYKNKRPVLADCETADKSKFNFTPEQLEQTAHVTAVWSWPIYEVDVKGRQTGNVIGLVNLDATAAGAFAKISQNASAFERSMTRFAEIASMIV